MTPHFDRRQAKDHSSVTHEAKPASFSEQRRRNPLPADRSAESECQPHRRLDFSQQRLVQ